MKIRRFKRYLQPKAMIYLLLIVGFLVGMILSFSMMDPERNKELLWLDQILMCLKYGEINYGIMIFYVLKKRISAILLIIILCLSEKGKYILLGGVVVVGGFMGYFITEFIIAKGILGSMLFFVSIFPHYLFYGYAFYRLLMALLIHKTNKSDIKRMGQNSAPDFGYKDRNIVKKLAPFAVVIIGILLECYVNPFFLKIFLKIFM